MITIITRVLLTALALLLAERVIPGIEVPDAYTAILAALALGLLNLFIKPILVILTFPITIVTLGLFMFVINAGLFLFASQIVNDFNVEGFIPAVFGSLVVSIVSAVGSRFIHS